MLCGFRQQFRFPSKSLIFTLNTSLYMPMYPCSLPNGNILTLILSYDFYPWALPRLSVGGGGVGGETRVRSVFEWVSLRRCARCDFGAKYLLHQAQYWAGLPLWFLGPQGTWGLISADYPEVRHCGHNCDPTVNPAFNVQNGFTHFLTMSRLKLASTTSASLPIIPSIKRKNGEKCFHLS